MNRLTRLQWVLIVAFVLALLGTSLFAVHTVRHALYWHAHREEPIRAWMNVPYIARSYRLPPHVLYPAIGLPAGQRDKRPLREIARAQKRPVTILIDELQEAISHSRPPYPPPPPPPPADKGKGPRA